LENQNPTGSIKDRIALSMIEAAEREGKLKARRDNHRSDRGQYRAWPRAHRRRERLSHHPRNPDKMSQEKIAHVRALGAEVRLTRSDVTRGHPEYYQDMRPA
jgi:cystathionine beta-synthase